MVITYHLNDVVAFNDDGLLVMQVPLLSGFNYPVAKLEASVLLPKTPSVAASFGIAG